MRDLTAKEPQIEYKLTLFYTYSWLRRVFFQFSCARTDNRRMPRLRENKYMFSFNTFQVSNQQFHACIHNPLFLFFVRKQRCYFIIHAILKALSLKFNAYSISQLSKSLVFYLVVLIADPVNVLSSIH